jgi:peptidylprolyl isomerase
VSNRVKPSSGTQRTGATGGAPYKGRPPARVARRNAQRAAAQAAAEQRAAARRRRWAIIGAAGGVVVIAVIIGLVVSLGGSKKNSTASTASAASSASASASASAGATPTSTAFPPLPAGADAALKTKPTVGKGTGTLTKLTTTTLIEGKGAAVKSGQTLNVNYVGVSFTTGKEFDSSWSRSQAFSFAVGQGNVIQGWDQGLVGVKVGSRVQLDIPSNLAYGDTSSNGSPTGPLRFVVDVLSAQ